MILILLCLSVTFFAVAEHDHDEGLACKSQEELQMLRGPLEAQRNEEFANDMQRPQRHNCYENFERDVEACMPVAGMSLVGGFLSKAIGFSLGTSLLCGAGTGGFTAACLALVMWPRTPASSSSDADIV